MNACDNKTVLTQSYRVPQSVFSLANSVVRRIDYRYQKDWNPMERHGDVQFHSSWYDIDVIRVRGLSWGGLTKSLRR